MLIHSATSEVQRPAPNCGANVATVNPHGFMYNVPSPPGHLLGRRRYWIKQRACNSLSRALCKICIRSWLVFIWLTRKLFRKSELGS